jgi:hypothetical protein
VCDLSRVRSKGAYLMGLVKRYRTGQVTVTPVTVTLISNCVLQLSVILTSCSCCAAVAVRQAAMACRKIVGSLQVPKAFY